MTAGDHAAPGNRPAWHGNAPKTSSISSEPEDTAVETIFPLLKNSLPYSTVLDLT